MSPEHKRKPIRKVPGSSTFAWPRLSTLAMLVGFGLLYTCFAWDRDFWAPEESDFAAITAEMGARGDWFVPRLAGLPYFEKPPLLYWFGLFFEKVLRLDPHLGYRLTAILFATFPAFTAVAAHFLLRDERLSLWKASGTALALVSVLLLRIHGDT